VIGITSKDCQWYRKDLSVEFQHNTCSRITCTYSACAIQTTDVIIILMMMVAWKLADPGIGESNAPPFHAYGPYIRPVERAKTPVIESPTYLTVIESAKQSSLDYLRATPRILLFVSTHMSTVLTHFALIARRAVNSPARPASALAGRKTGAEWPRIYMF
jgi:hypothetical protein